MSILGVVNKLKDLGFTEYEARIYIALLRSHPANGNSIATLSGVPTPKVYETLRKMQERHLVFVVSGGDKRNHIRYSPLPYKELLAKTRQSFVENLAFLENALLEISSKSDNDWTELFVIHGYSAAMDAVRSAITDCRYELIMSCWKQELQKLEESLRTAHQRGVSIVTLIFDAEIDVPWRNFTHYRGEFVRGRHAGELSIVVDQEKAIVLESLNDRPHAIVSSHPVTIKTTRNYIRHDIYVNRILHDFEEVMKQRYGNELEQLVDDF